MDGYIALVQFDNGGHAYLGPENDLGILIAAAKGEDDASSWIGAPAWKKNAGA